MAARKVWEGNEQLRRLLVPIASLSPHPRNPRVHALPKIVESLVEFGQQRPILVVPAGRVTDTPTIVAGHGTTLAATEAGWTHIAVIESDLTDALIDKYVAADNRTADEGRYDEELLAQLLGGLPDLQGTGYSSDDLAELMAKRAPAAPTDLNDAPPVPEEAKSVLGGVYDLGPHRLVCGSCRDDVGWDLLDRRCQVLFTSPPYALGDSFVLRGRPEGVDVYEDHDDDPGDWPNLMREFMEQGRARTSVQVVNVQMLAGNKRALTQWLADNADGLIDVAIWAKDHAAPAMAPGVFTSAYEMLILFGKAGASRRVPFSSFRGDQSNVVNMAPQHHNPNPELNGATMPLDLAVYVLRNWVTRCQTVVDPFAGSGTTMVACEQLGKSCAMIEIDPRFCDVIRQRYADMAGRPDLAP